MFDTLKAGDILTDAKGNSVEVLEVTTSGQILGRKIGFLNDSASFAATVSQLGAIQGLTVTTLESRIQTCKDRIAHGLMVQSTLYHLGYLEGLR